MPPRVQLKHARMQVGTLYPVILVRGYSFLVPAELSAAREAILQAEVESWLYNVQNFRLIL